MKTTTQPFSSFLEFQKMYPDEQTCIRLLEQIRWGDAPVCIRCGHGKAYRLAGGKLLKCAACKERFTVKQGTIFEESRLPLNKWMYVMYLFANHRKGISSHQVGRDIDVSQKTAWFMLGRLRYAFAHRNFSKPLSGTVEVDETYVGGKESNKHKNKKLNKGRGTVGKTAVVGLVEREGNVRVHVTAKTDGATLLPIIRDNVATGATVCTDEMAAYNELGSTHRHETVNHGQGEYYRDGVHTNTIDGFWAQLKRGLYSTYHHASPKHLHRYADEFAYRHDTRKVSDPDRFVNALQTVGGRLTYAELTGKEA